MNNKITTKSGSSITGSDRIEKLSDEELITEFARDNFYMGEKKDFIEHQKVIDRIEKIKKTKEELLKRLSQNNIEEFKKRLIEKILQYNIDVKNTSRMMSENLIEYLINNLKERN